MFGLTAPPIYVLTPLPLVDTHPGHFTRMSHSPLFEWHSFATISVPGKKGHSVIISRAGDWTSEQIAEPPKRIWIRDVPTFGVVAVTPLFRRVVLVATGSGIAPIAPVVYAKKVPLQLLWVAPNVRKTFGDPLVDSLIEANPNAAIYGGFQPQYFVPIFFADVPCTVAPQILGCMGSRTW